MRSVAYNEDATFIELVNHHHIRPTRDSVSDIRM